VCLGSACHRPTLSPNHRRKQKTASKNADQPPSRTRRLRLSQCRCVRARHRASTGACSSEHPDPTFALSSRLRWGIRSFMAARGEERLKKWMRCSRLPSFSTPYGKDVRGSQRGRAPVSFLLTRGDPSQPLHTASRESRTRRVSLCEESAERRRWATAA